MKIDSPPTSHLYSRLGRPHAAELAADTPFWIEVQRAEEAVTVTMTPPGTPDVAAVFVPEDNLVSIYGASPWPGAMKAVADLARKRNAALIRGMPDLARAVVEVAGWSNPRLVRSQIVSTRSMAQPAAASTVKMRQPKDGELDQLALWCAADATGSPPEEGWRSVLDFLKADRRVLVAADEQDVPIGMVSWNVVSYTDMDDAISSEVVDLTNVSVVQDKRRHGTGRGMIDSLLGQLSAKPASYGRADRIAVARVESANEPGLAFWNKLGFHSRGTVETWVRAS